MLRGLTTTTYFADDVTAARDWYAEVLGTEAYFGRDADGTLAYAEFRIGDYQHELGILDRRFAPVARTGEPAGAVAYWAVDDVEAAYARLLALGAVGHDEPTERGPGFVTAIVVDPFGNLLGVMENAHYLEVLTSRRG
ncbi:putative enzyme related to lactoylglutathione lyase [Isoptericola sp. CG 20/1183]|uniref:Enzyme related to lactoylglutathione lyase n=1 Tax=Isoptericola halotolerans TaxID=300560 RepID=A0ABX5EE95_9MICO|nr:MULTISPECIES: VOC family protein [Isoptericola]PRZ05178.1 putative enzyme related to lactoylglutathione lyase [Isoptericola halotolerans]PRZ05916.1 putative enzyme related to lactoylglutathione lyase [Isoptericola sp. CG 20/1183]